MPEKSYARTVIATVVTALLSVGCGGGAFLAAQAYAGRSAPVGQDPSPGPSSPAPAAPSPSVVPSGAPEALSDQALAVAVSATVRLAPPDGSYSGSGTVLSSDGLVLTNAHVAQPGAPGSAIRQASSTPPELAGPPYLVVSVSPPGDGPAEPRYRASVLAVDGYLDLAVLRIDALVDGTALAAGTALPFLPRGSIADVEKNDRLTALGFPGLTGGQRVDVTEGTIRNLLPDAGGRVPGDRYTVATTLDIAGGNSGGAAVDTAGRLVAVPSARLLYREAETTGLLVPVDLAQPLIEAAQTGQPYVSPWFTPMTGEEQARDLGWGEGTSDCGQLGRLDLPAGGDSLSWAVVVDGLSPEQDVMVEVEPELGRPAVRPARWDGDRCLVTTVTAAELGLGDLLPGDYEARLLVGPTYEELLTSQVELVGRDD